MLDELKAKLQAIIDEYKTVSQTKQAEFKTAANPPAPIQTISAAVGKGGANIPAEVELVQRLLNQKLNLTLSTDGKIGAKTQAAIEQFQKAIFNGWADGKIDPGGNTWKQLSGNNPLPNPNNNPTNPQKPTGKGQNGKVGNKIYPIGAAWLSVPPNASGAMPLVVLFAGKGQAANALMKDCPDSYYQKAILIFAASNGSYSSAVAATNPILTQHGCSIGTISICGYSLGGQAAYRNYSNATKAVGLIDPTTYWSNLAVLDNKAVLSCRPAIWTFGGNYGGTDPKKKANYTAGDAQRDAVEIIKNKGGFAETTQVNHGAYPKYFLSNFESKLI